MGFNLKAFFLSFTYYFYKKLWWYGVLEFVAMVILPISCYFPVSLIGSMILWKMNSKGRSFGGTWKNRSIGIVISCLSVFLCLICKYWIYRWIA